MSYRSTRIRRLVLDMQNLKEELSNMSGYLNRIGCDCTDLIAQLGEHATNLAAYEGEIQGEVTLERAALRSILTGTEIDVLEKAAAGGFNRKQIGKELSLTEKAVDRYFSNIYRKLGIDGPDPYSQAINRYNEIIEECGLHKILPF